MSRIEDYELSRHNHELSLEELLKELSNSDSHDPVQIGMIKYYVDHIRLMDLWIADERVAEAKRPFWKKLFKK